MKGYYKIKRVTSNEFNTHHAGKGPKDLNSDFLCQLGHYEKRGSPLLKTNEKNPKIKTIETCFHHTRGHQAMGPVYS